MSQESVQAYWQKFLSTLPTDSLYHSRTYSEGGYGDSPELMDELIQLVLIGKKTATCGSLWEREAEGKPLTKVGDIWVELDGSGNPVCITETIEVTIRKYNEVDADFARAEGEGDLSLSYWLNAHRNFFSRVLSKIGKEFSEDMPLVCERFRLIYK
ncbi:MAG TPA: ASCH domain-containing protein [Anaerolineales bacterium]|nr:ASCH domain-containing protein [Anaerolineales bacterium]